MVVAVTLALLTETQLFRSIDGRSVVEHVDHGCVVGGFNLRPAVSPVLPVIAVMLLVASISSAPLFSLPA